MNIFVAFFVLLLLLAESTPPAASAIPLIGKLKCLSIKLKKMQPSFYHLILLRVLLSSQFFRSLLILF